MKKVKENMEGLGLACKAHRRAARALSISLFRSLSLSLCLACKAHRRAARSALACLACRGTSRSMCVVCCVSR
jgi:hypothetical protein